MAHQMSITQAARWADRNSLVYRVNKYTGAPEYMYAAYDISTNLVEVIGHYEKCSAVVPPRGQQTSDGRWLRLISLDEVLEELRESEGEALIPPDACEVREWA